VRPAVLLGARAALLGGPVALAFATGGFLDRGRLVAGIAAWALVAVAALALPGPLVPRRPAAWIALGGLAGLAAWTLVSLSWAPAAAPALDAAQIALLDLGALAAATLLLADPRARRWVEPALAAGTLVLVGYALTERVLPGVVELSRSLSAQGRLEQPLTYWNGMGAVAAFGCVLCARLCGDGTRPVALRAAAAAAAVVLGCGLSLTVSRGALFAGLAGLVALVVAAPSAAQLRAAALVVGAGLAGALVAAPFDGVTSLAGSPGGRSAEGAVVLAGLVVLAAAAAVAARALAARPDAPLRLPRRAPVLALVVVLAGFAAAVALGGTERREALRPDAGRFVTLTSNRYAYWEVALRAFADEPLRGVGAAGWRVRWRAEREFREGARDAHSLPLQTAAELGLVGLALLAALVAGIALAARDALRDGPAAAGAVAGLVVLGAHSALDWDWQLPAVLLPGFLLAGVLLAWRPGPRAPSAYSSSAIRGASRANTRTATTQTRT
jgi:hypothetical protein